MAIREITFTSFNVRDTIQGWMYTPITKPRAIVQIVHGFGEHSRRYMHMILELNKAGFIVVADDHVAHGKTAKEGNSWGNPGDNGFMTTIEDEHTLRNIATKEYPELPYIMFGHSWGSMIARGYTAVHGQNMAGAIFCGTPAQLKPVDEMRGELNAAVAAGRGNENGLEFGTKLFAGMVDRYENPNGPNDWIALEADVVADHAADPLNNMAGANIHLFNDFAELYHFISDENWAKKVPQSLPVYIIAGDQDPVGNYGEGIYHVANLLWETGHKKIITKVYSGYRHEIHNEPPIREEVEAGIIAFIESVL